MKMSSRQRAPGPFTASRRGRCPRRPCKYGTVAAILSRPRRPALIFTSGGGRRFESVRGLVEKPRKKRGFCRLSQQLTQRRGYERRLGQRRRALVAEL